MTMTTTTRDLHNAHKAMIKAHANLLTNENALEKARAVLLSAHKDRDQAQCNAEQPGATPSHWMDLGGALERSSVVGKAYDQAANATHEARYEFECAQNDHISALDSAFYSTFYSRG
jgi:heme oxygenase